MAVLDAFRAGNQHVLVATDIAARGLDIKTLKTVINFDAAKDFDTHIHRVGRTGRAGDKEGVAYTLLLPSESRFAAQLAQSLTLGSQMVPKELQELALKSRFAAQLAQSLTLGSQVVPKELQALAIKDPQYARGDRVGGGGRKGGRGGRGGRGRPAVGGAGLGFGPTGAAASGGGNAGGLHFAQSGSDFVQLPGFSKSSAAGGPGAGGGGGWGPPRSPLLVHSDTAPQAPPRALQGGRFKTFVSSGTTGGDIGAMPTVQMPKVRTSMTLPPPPVPVTQRPMFLQQQAGGFGQRSGGFGQGGPGPRGLSSDLAEPSHYGSRGGSGRGGGGSSFNNAPPPSSLNASSYNNAPPPGGLNAGAGGGQAAAQSAAAIAAAQAIAERLTQGQPR
eukprot:gene25237-10883_t